MGEEAAHDRCRFSILEKVSPVLANVPRESYLHACQPVIHRSVVRLPTLSQEEHPPSSLSSVLVSHVVASTAIVKAS